MRGIRHVGIPGRATLLVLGMLFLRALVPAGFMVAPMDGRIAIVLCDAEMSASAHPFEDTHPHEHPHEHHHHGSAPEGGRGNDAVTGSLAHHGGAHHGAHADPTCPYAQSAGPAPLPALPLLAGGGVSDRPVPPAFITQTFLTCGPARQQTPRGPPSLA